MKKILLSLIISITTYLGATATANANTTVPVDLAACCHKISDDSVFKHCMQQALKSDIQDTVTKYAIKNCVSEHLSKDLNCLATYAKHQNKNARIMYKTDNKTYKFDMKIEELLKQITFDNQIALWLYTQRDGNYHPSDTIPRTNLTTVWWSDDNKDLKKLTLESLKKIKQDYTKFGFAYIRPYITFPGIILHKSKPLIMDNFYTALQHYNALQDGLQNSDCCKGYDLYIVTGDKKFTNLPKDGTTKITILYGPYLN